MHSSNSDLKIQPRQHWTNPFRFRICLYRQTFTGAFSCQPRHVDSVQRSSSKWCSYILSRLTTRCGVGLHNIQPGAKKCHSLSGWKCSSYSQNTFFRSQQLYMIMVACHACIVGHVCQLSVSFDSISRGHGTDLTRRTGDAAAWKESANCSKGSQTQETIEKYRK